MKNHSILQLVLILTPFVFSFAFGLDIYIPIVPQMTEVFETTPAMVQMTLSLFILTTGFGQLFIGPFSDQFGRVKTFYFSSFLYVIGALACAFSTHIAELIISRFISAFGACGMLVTAFALVRDLFSKEQSAKMYSLLNGAIGISPTLAPIIGGYLASYFGWHSVFFFLALIGTIAIAFTRGFIYETLPQKYRVKADIDIFKRYIAIVKNRQFFVYSMLAGLSQAVFFCFFSVSPFIIIDLLQIPTHEFGYYFAAFGLVIALGGAISGKLVEKMGIPGTTKVGISLMFLGGASMLIWSYLAPLSLVSFLAPMVIACTGAIFLVGSAASAALEPFGKIAGTASAAFGAIEFGVPAIVGSLLMLFPILSTLPYAICILIMASLSLSLFMLRNKPQTYAFRND